MDPSSLPLQPNTTNRRSANYQPSIWTYEYIQSLRSNYVGESFGKRVGKLKEEVRIMLTDTVKDTLHQLELIDTLQRLGVSYHFKNEIKSTLSVIDSDNKQKRDSLYAIALEFRLLRQHGYDISAEIFSNFRDEKGNFKSCLKEDCEGILYLYEAAYLLEEGEESIFRDVRNFTTTYLKEYVKHKKDEYLSKLVNHALDIPLYWRMKRLEARWFIDVYGEKKNANPILIEFAKLDFNFVQAKLQEDLQHASRWWRNSSLGELGFVRDCIVESFLWPAGSLDEPQFAYCRRLLAKLAALVTIIDDVYDVYGTLDELELFTDAIERWDVNAMEQLPHYMKICFFVVHNSINEIAFDALKERGIHIIPYLKKAWAEICKAFLVEAKWYYSGHKPTLEEFIDTTWITIGAPLVTLGVYCFITNPTEKDVSECSQEYRNIIYCISLIVRYTDDLGTASNEMKRGDVPKSIQCYMHETGASEVDAREHVRELIIATWMKMNKERVPCTNAFVEFGRNLMRVSLCLYIHGEDAYVMQEGETKNFILSLFVNPIPE